MKILYNKEQIQTAVNKIALEIHNKHYNDPNPPVMICVLNGAFMFFTDLVKAINIDCEIDFIRAKSYSDQLQTEVVITKDIETDIAGKNVYLIDDILDSGNTLRHIIKRYSTNKRLAPASITPVVLFKKWSSDIEDCLYGIELVNETWLCGYGLDGHDGLMRNRDLIFGFEPEID
jgi:hypoxanthine phosphoribosyltransferase